MRELVGSLAKIDLLERLRAHLYRSFISFLVQFEISQFQTFCPVAFVKVHQHGLLELRLPVVDSDGIIMTIETMDE